MPRKSKKLVALEVLEQNSTWDYRKTRILNNFICNQDDIEKVINMDCKEAWRKERGYDTEVKGIVAPRGTRGASDFFFTDDVSIEEVKLPSSIKPSTKYVYKIYDYHNEKLNIEYGTQKDVLAYISKKIKTKFVYVNYNGASGKIEFSPKVIAETLTGLEPTTSQFIIEPVGRAETPDNSIMISIFKNCLK